LDASIGREAVVPGEHVASGIQLSEKGQGRPSWASCYDASKKVERYAATAAAFREANAREIEVREAGRASLFEVTTGAGGKAHRAATKARERLAMRLHSPCLRVFEGSASGVPFLNRGRTVLLLNARAATRNSRVTAPTLEKARLRVASVDRVSPLSASGDQSTISRGGRATSNLLASSC